MKFAAAAIAIATFGLGGPARASDWIERYFGVGSAGTPDAACVEARDHAQGNSFKACIDRRGKRSEAAYTDCICSDKGQEMHVCNVNLKVRCEVSSAGGGPQHLQKRGEPKGQAGMQAQAERRPAPKAAAGLP